MSKRVEEKAMKAYPVHSVLIQPARRGGYYADGHFREGFIKGYEQAEKDTIERAVNVLINLPSLVIPSNYIAYFRKKMMEEDNG